MEHYVVILRFVRVHTKIVWNFSTCNWLLLSYISPFLIGLLLACHSFGSKNMSLIHDKIGVACREIIAAGAFRSLTNFFFCCLKKFVLKRNMINKRI